RFGTPSLKRILILRSANSSMLLLLIGWMVMRPQSSPSGAPIQLADRTLRRGALAGRRPALLMPCGPHSTTRSGITRILWRSVCCRWTAFSELLGWSIGDVQAALRCRWTAFSELLGCEGGPIMSNARCRWTAFSELLGSFR